MGHAWRRSVHAFAPDASVAAWMGSGDTALLGRFSVGTPCHADCMDDEQIMSGQQQQLLRTIIEAINRSDDLYGAAGNVSPPPDPNDIRLSLRILRLPDIGFRHGEPADLVIARIMDLYEARIEDDTSQATITDDRY